MPDDTMTYEQMFRETQAAYGRQERRNNAYRQALARLLDATEPYVEEAAPGETLIGPWCHRFNELVAARQAASDALSSLQSRKDPE